MSQSFPALFFSALLLVVPTSGVSGSAETSPDEAQPMIAKTFAGLKFRSIGPALTSGRISDLAVHPGDSTIRYLAAASGGVWMTTNSGTTWTPIFDDQGSYSIGCIAIDRKNPLIVWVGTGENNSQRSVSYGDGVYKSVDGGRSWKNMGLKTSEHIGKIVVDPRDSKTVYVAAQGPLWNSGGDRGLFKTRDGGETWKLVLEVSPDTGVSDLVLDPRNPDVLFSTSYQRRRHVWTLIDGGPESTVYKSSDGGETWAKSARGLPKEDLGRIGLAISPVNPDVLYAIVEAANESGGFFRSRDAGSHWKKMSSYVSSSPQYYQEIVADPVQVNRVYSMDTWMQVTEDGGKTFKRVGEKYKHVDNHALWIDPADNRHLLAGCDGGVYESFDRGATWNFTSNLPVTQFYKVAVDNDSPFYNVYGGTQDNFSLGGPSRTTNVHGIRNSDWFVTQGGDGFQTQVDPQNPNIVYSELQYGRLVRFDRRSGQRIDIQPQAGPGEEPLRWNWDAPLIISPHQHTRLYFASSRVFRSDDRGDTWTAISPDLTRQIDRNQLEVMERVWGPDAVAKNASTSFYGNIVALAESPLSEGLLYAGTDDGLIQVASDSGSKWRKIESFPGVPKGSYVSDIAASTLDENTVFAALDNHKMGDFKPYLLKSADRGKNWTSIAGNLPEKGTVYSVVQDHLRAELLFAGTEFGVFFTLDGGVKWVRLKGGLPTIAVRDLAIQRRENDLVLATFGRGFYILEDYTPLRLLKLAMLEQEAVLFPVKKTWMYIQGRPLGLGGKSFQGDSFFAAPNPPFGAVLTYYLKEELKTRKKRRQEKEKKRLKAGQPMTYPDWDQLRQEAREEKPAVILTITDSKGNVVRRLTGPTTAGFHRVAWDLRLPASTPTELKQRSQDNPFAQPRRGPMVVPGTYQVSLARGSAGERVPLSTPQSIATEALDAATLPAPDRAALLAFQRQTAGLQRAVLGAVRAAREAATQMKYIKKSILEAPQAGLELRERARLLEIRLKDFQMELSGDPVRGRYNAPRKPSIVGRVQRIVSGHWASTSAPTTTQRHSYQAAADAFAPLLERLRTLIETDLSQLGRDLEKAGVPWSPGRVPRWEPK
ncbi:MAG: glycosyl hydrolase [Acidobacteriota bacterium]